MFFIVFTVVFIVFTVVFIVFIVVFIVFIVGKHVVIVVFIVTVGKHVVIVVFIVTVGKQAKQTNKQTKQRDRTTKRANKQRKQTNKTNKPTKTPTIVSKNSNDDTGVCKINGVVKVVNYCYSMGFSTTNNNKNTVYFANTGKCCCLFALCSHTRQQ